MLFAVVDAVLVVAALRHASPAAAPHGAGAAHPSPVPTQASPEPSPGGEATRAPMAGDGPLLLSLAGDGTLVAADPGSCDGSAGAQVRVSTDGGASFLPVTVRRPVTSVLSVRAVSSDEVGVVATDKTCTPHRYVGSAGSMRWTRTGPDHTWHRLPGEQQAVHSPGGRSETPCVPVALTAPAPVRLLCRDGRVLGTSDGGASWPQVGRLPEGRLIAFTDGGSGYGIATVAGCRNALTTSTDGGATWQQQHCFRRGEVRALSATGQRLVAVVGEVVMTSSDAGRTWSRAS